jgi:hypothetical protein
VNLTKQFQQHQNAHLEISGTEGKRNERIGVELTAKRSVRYGDQEMTGGGFGI